MVLGFGPTIWIRSRRKPRAENSKFYITFETELTGFFFAGTHYETIHIHHATPNDSQIAIHYDTFLRGYTWDWRMELILGEMEKCLHLEQRSHYLLEVC
jgi:hypothetical protein